MDMLGFTITQFFQVLKLTVICLSSEMGFTITQFFQVLKSILFVWQFNVSFTITQFFQVLKLFVCIRCIIVGFTITQFFQVLKYQISKSFSSIFKNSPLLFFKNAISRLLTSVSNTVS